jgi:hypothetical protein
MKSKVVDIWLCCFPSAEKLDAYFEETYDEDDDVSPISQYAADINQPFYDVDFMLLGEFQSPPFTSIVEALAEHVSSWPYLESQIAEKFQSNPFGPFNNVLFMFDGEIKNPVSIAKPEATLHYLGRFIYEQPKKKVPKKSTKA